MSALKEILHGFWRNLLFIGGGWGLAEGCALATGAPPAPGDLAGVACGFAAALLAYPSVREGVLRTALRRPRRTMTPDDYRRLRELEGELGWELSEAPASVTDPIRSELARVRAEAVRAAARADRTLAKADRALREAQAARQALRPSGTGSLTAKPLHPGGVWSTSGSGRCTCPPCQQSMREARGKSPETVAAEHFAGLARVGREHCLTYCPICQYRLFGPIPDGVKPDKSMWQWAEENWGWKQ